MALWVRAWTPGRLGFLANQLCNLRQVNFFILIPQFFQTLIFQTQSISISVTGELYCKSKEYIKIISQFP